MSNASKSALILVVGIVLGAGLDYVYRAYYRGSSGSEEKVKMVTATPAPDHFPVPPSATDVAMNSKNTDSLAASSSLSASLLELLGKEKFDESIEPGDVIRNFVVTVDNLTTSKVPLQYLPLKAPAKKIQDGEGKEEDANITLGQENFNRYSSYVRLVEALDLEALSKLYIHFYPMLQKSYEELGHKKYFNDRFVEVIDNVLKAPDIKEPIHLVRSVNVYQFEDDKLEALPIGQKIMLRMGPDNEEKMKVFLRALRDKLTHLLG